MTGSVKAIMRDERIVSVLRRAGMEDYIRPITQKLIETRGNAQEVFEWLRDAATKGYIERWKTLAILTDEQLDLQKRARDFAQEYMIPYAKYYDKTGEFPRPIIQKCWEAGLMNLGIPKEYGGPGLGILEQCIVVEELAAGCPGMTTSIYVNSLGAEPILVAGTTEQKEERWARYQKDVDALRTRNPKISYTAACHRVARQHGVHYNTVRNHTQK